MKLSILKWVYDLGYKKAEDRYYHALMEEARSIYIELEYSRAQETEKEKEERQGKLLDRRHDLSVVINNVFHPKEQVEIESKSRFLP